MATKTNFLANNNGVPQVNTPQTTSSGAASGQVVGLNSSSTVDVSIGGTGLVNPTAHNVLVGEGSSPVGVVAPSATSGVPLVSQGSSSDPAFGTAVVAGGGTGQTTLTAHAVLVGNGTDAVTQVATSSTAGYVLTSNGSGSDPSFQAPGSSAITLTVTASEAISAGALINLYSNSGTVNVRNADNTNVAKQCHGYAPSAISSSASGSVTLGNALVSSLSGLTVGPVFLGTTGSVTSTAPSSSGDIIQPVGFATSATTLFLNPGQPVSIA